MNELEQRWRDLGEFIREQRRGDRLSLRKLAEMAGVSNPYLSQIERGLRKPSAEILQQIARALEISAETLYVRAGILDETDLEQDLPAAIRRDARIDEDQKKTLIHIYESFVAERESRGVTGESLPPPRGTLADPASPVDSGSDPADSGSEPAPVAAAEDSSAASAGESGGAGPLADLPR